MEISITGIDEIVNRVNRYANLEQKVEEVARRLCEIGKPIIARIHGHHSTALDYRKENDGYVLFVEGTDVLFIEFGAGNATGGENANYDAVPDVVRPGSWSEAHQGEYYKTGGYPVGHWHFPANREINEVKPSPALYYAYEYMVQKIPEVVKDVFK